jgi:chromosome segregation ATPase
VYKFLHGARPKFEQVVVTAETEVPATVEKSLRKKEPSKDEYEKKMKELDSKIMQIREHINTLSLKKKEAREGGKVKGTTISYKEFLNQKIEEIRGLRDQKRDLYNQKNAIIEQIKVIELEREQILKTLPSNKDLQDPVKIQAKIDELEKRYKSTSMALQEEKRLINDIKKLQESMSSARKVQEMRPRLDVLYGQRNKFSELINALKPSLEAKELEIETLRKQLNDDQDQRDDVKDKLTKFDDDITLLKADLQKVFDLKDATREEHFKNRYEYQIEQDEIKYAERIAREKQRLIDAEKLKQERIAAQKKTLADRPNPYLKEIETCDRLVQYCQLLRRKVGLVQTEEVIKEEQK